MVFLARASLSFASVYSTSAVPVRPAERWAGTLQQALFMARKLRATTQSVKQTLLYVLVAVIGQAQGDRC